MIVKYFRRGRVVTRPSEFSSAYGHYYVDLEVVSIGGGAGQKVRRGEVLDIGGEYVISGFQADTQPGFERSINEDIDLVVTPYAPNSSGDLVGVAHYQFEVVYSTSPTTRLLQNLITTENYRATADDALAKAKPIMRIGVGPITSVSTVSISQLVSVINENISSILQTRTYITLGDVMGWLSPYGVLSTLDTRLIVAYQDVDRTRKLLLGNTVSVHKLWHIEADADLITQV